MSMSSPTLPPCLKGVTLILWNSSWIFRAGSSPSVQLWNLRTFVSPNPFPSYFLLLGSRGSWLFNWYLPFVTIKALLTFTLNVQITLTIVSSFLCSVDQCSWMGCLSTIFIYLAKILGATTLCQVLDTKILILGGLRTHGYPKRTEREPRQGNTGKVREGFLEDTMLKLSWRLSQGFPEVHRGKGFVILNEQWVQRACVRAQLLQSCPILCNPMDCNPPGSSVHGIFQARILEWSAMPSSRGSFWPRDQTHISCVSSTADSLPLSHLGSPMYKVASAYYRQLFSL